MQKKCTQVFWFHANLMHDGVHIMGHTIVH